MTTETALDLITLAVIKNSLEQITDEMDVLLYRAAFSTIISEGHDACHGLYDAETGETVVQGKFGLPIFVGVMRFAVNAVIKRAAEVGVAPGDVFVFNDPHLSGTHLQDMKLVRPVFYNGTLFGWLAGTAHWSDVGGNTPGGFNAKATEVWQEGFRIRPVKLFNAGKLNEDILDILLANSRTPQVAYGDLSAQINALEIGEKRLVELLDKYGVELVKQVVRELRVRSEKMMRAYIQQIPDGIYSFEDFLDNDGLEDVPLKVAVDLTVQGDEMTLDFSRSSAPCKGPFNMPLATSIASCYIAVKHVFTDVPVNSGCFAPVKFVIPETTFLNAGAGKAMSAYTEVTPAIINCIWGALGQAIPDKVNAAYFTTVNSLNIAGLRDDDKPYLMFTYFGGGHGASPVSDGLNHGSNAISMATIAPVEILEGNFPVLFDEWALRSDSGGAGYYRGGLGSVYKIRLLGKGGKAYFLGDKGKFPPFGVNGGGPAATNEIIFRHHDHDERPPMVAKAVDVELIPGEVIELRTPGGGGYGDPLTRPIEKVLLDLKKDYISIETAREKYGVALKPDGSLDTEETTRLRGQIRE
jgi:N-methylhydantoinase B